MRVPNCPKCGKPMPDVGTSDDVFDFRCLSLCHREQIIQVKPNQILKIMRKHPRARIVFAKQSFAIPAPFDPILVEAGEIWLAGGKGGADLKSEFDQLLAD